MSTMLITVVVDFNYKVRFIFCDRPGSYYQIWCHAVFAITTRLCFKFILSTMAMTMMIGSHDFTIVTLYLFISYFSRHTAAPLLSLLQNCHTFLCCKLYLLVVSCLASLCIPTLYYLFILYFSILLSFLSWFVSSFCIFLRIPGGLYLRITAPSPHFHF